MKKLLMLLFLFSGIAMTQLSAQSCCVPKAGCCSGQKTCTTEQMKKCTPEQMKSCSGASGAQSSSDSKPADKTQNTAVTTTATSKPVAVRTKD